MPSSLQSTLTAIEKKISLLEQSRSQLAQRCSELERANADLESKLRETEKLLEAQRLDSQFLTVSHRLADSPDTIVEARRKISNIIRRIDKAISLATDDPSL